MCCFAMIFLSCLFIVNLLYCLKWNIHKSRVQVLSWVEQK